MHHYMYYVLAPVPPTPFSLVLRSIKINKHECTRDPITLYFPLFFLEWHKLNEEYTSRASAFGWGLLRLLKLKIVNNFSVNYII